MSANLEEYKLVIEFRISHVTMVIIVYLTS